MTKETKKPKDNVTKAGAFELEEQDLENVQGGLGLLLPAVQKVREAATLTADGSVRIESADRAVLGDGSV